MIAVQAINLNCVVLEETGERKLLYPYLRFEHGDKTMWQVSPIHGRSYVVGRTDNGRYVVSKGNGLGYTQLNFLYTSEQSTDVWGLLLKEDALRLERFLRRISLLTEAFVGTSWPTLALPKKVFKIVPSRPGAKISDRPIPFYYNASYENFRQCWRAGNTSPVSFVINYEDNGIPYMERLSNGKRGWYSLNNSFVDDGMQYYLQGYQGMSVNLLVDFITQLANANGWIINIDKCKILKDKDFRKDPYLRNMGKERIKTVHMGGLTSYCTLTIFHNKGKVVTYAVAKFVK